MKLGNLLFLQSTILYKENYYSLQRKLLENPKERQKKPQRRTLLVLQYELLIDDRKLHRMLYESCIYGFCI